MYKKRILESYIMEEKIEIKLFIIQLVEFMFQLYK